MYNLCVIIVMFVLAWTGWIVPVMATLIYILPVLFLVVAIADFTSPPLPRRKPTKEQ
jgi:hypothetical protein